MLDVKTKSQDSISIIEIDGEVDLYSSPALRKALLEMTKAQNKAILVDLARVKYMDSSGVATLVEALQQVGKYDGKLKLANLRDGVKNVFELSRLDKVFDIYESIEDAKKSF
ncbi:MAG: anti-sigma factor antagonist [Caldithrix sp.]|nr:MAG: anti-sigma factor antagonist [Caldithrix sp.]